MAKELKFKIADEVYGLEPVKLDRKKMYGSREKIILDDKDSECNALSLYSDMAMLIPKGGIGLGSISEDGRWVEKSDMMYVNEDGTPAELVPSSYDGEIELNKSVSIEVFLEHNITSIYTLQGEENHPGFVKAIQDNKEVFTFIFNFRADYEGTPAFVIENEGEVFILIGKRIEFEFLGLEAAGILDVEDDTVEEEVDEFDFEMF